jgi:putative hydrolase of the HAD superfamily
VFFDLGGTLVDERDPNLWAEEAAAVGLEVEPEALAHWFEESERENDLAGGRWSLEEFWGRVLAGARGAAVDPPRLRAFLSRVAARERPAPLFTDVRWCLRELRRRFQLGIISNSRSEASVSAILRRAGVREYFATVVSSGTEGVAKPDPEIFHRALGRLRLRPSQAFYVGNLPHVDALAARAAGLHAIWLHRGGTGFGEEPPEITSLSELPLAVRAAERRA